jgi:hypothetical protein
MNISTKLITAQYIKDNTVVQQLVPDINLDSFIYQTQDFYLRPTLGVDLYNELINDYNANSGYTDSGFTGNNFSILLSYCKPYLAYQTVYEAFPYFSIKIANAGLIRRTGAGDYEPIGLDELKYYRQDVYNKGNYTKTLLEDFLKDNRETYYPSATTISCNTSINGDRKTLGGFYF